MGAGSDSSPNRNEIVLVLSHVLVWLPVKSCATWSCSVPGLMATLFQIFLKERSVVFVGFLVFSSL